MSAGTGRAWDDDIGYCQPHQLHEGDLVRKRMAAERMRHPPTALNRAMIDAVAGAVGECAAASIWQIAGAAIETTHMHLLMSYSDRDIEKTCKWISQQTTKAVHRETPFEGPVWCEGKWLGFVFDLEHWKSARRYIERHNERRGFPARPWEWITV